MTDKPFSAEAFLEFCRGKPADERYDYCTAVGCAWDQYLIASGVAERDLPIFPPNTGGIGDAIRADGNVTDWTFGSLADRLEKAIADQGGKL